MSQLTTCPPATQIGDITVDSCPFDVGQVQKIIFQRQFSTGTTRNVMTVADADTLATWTAFLTATDATKVQVSPFVNGPTFDPGTSIEFGSGNDVVDGIPLAVGVEPTSFTSNMFRISSASKESLVALEGEDLVAYFVDEHGRIWGETDSNASPVSFYGIPIFSYHVGDRKIGGKVEPDANVLSFKLRPRWDNKLKSITPVDFDALTALSGS